MASRSWAAFSRYSVPLRLFFVLVSLGLLLIVLLNWANIFVLPIILAGPLVIYQCIYRRRLRLEDEGGAQDEGFWRMFAAGCIPGSLFALAVELFLSLVIGTITLGPQFAQLFDDIAKKQAEDPDYVPTEEQLTLKKGFGYWAYLFLTAFVTAACVEETVKALLVRHVCCGMSPDRACCIQRADPRPKHHAHNTMSLLLATSLGFSLAENFMYVFAAAGEGAEVGLNPAFGYKMLLALIRTALAMPVHATCACFTGLRLALRDVQRRQRDGALLAQAFASGVPQFAVLPSGVSIALGVQGDPDGQPSLPPGLALSGSGSPQTSAPPPPGEHGAPLVGHSGPVQAIPVSSLIQALYAPGGGVGGLAGATAATGAARSGQGAGGGDHSGARRPGVNPASIKVWSWPRVLWPAVVIHGTYDFVAMALGELAAESEGAALFLTLLSAAVIVVAAVWALVSQFRAAFEVIASGEVPPVLTCAPMWWPAALRTVAGRWGLLLPESGWPGTLQGLDTATSSSRGWTGASVGGGGVEGLAYVPAGGGATVPGAAQHWQGRDVEAEGEARDTAPLVAGPRA